MEDLYHNGNFASHEIELIPQDLNSQAGSDCSARRSPTYWAGSIIQPDGDGGRGIKPYERWVEMDTNSVATLENNIACCVTAYNEHGAALLVSLLGLIRNGQRLALQKTSKGAAELAICVIVDGADKISSSFFHCAEECGFIDSRCLDAGSDIHVYESYSDGSALSDLLSAYLSNDEGNEWLISNKGLIEDKFNSTHGEYDEYAQIRVVFYIKSENKGKLDSHWHFFEVICQYLGPKYCIQMDVGTNPCVDAVERMLEVVEHQERIGVVACRSYIPAPRHSLEILKVWQFADMLKERVVVWPTEALLGYLSVMPGQMCMMKWDAVNSRHSPAACPSDFETSDESRSKVLTSYYRGLEQNGPFESNMFLAEDRILGFEIANNKSTRWKIDYAPKSEATTDACNSWQELLHQRRRWICSSFSCKIWFLLKLNGYLIDASKKPADKAGMLMSSLYFLLDILLNWFSIGLIIVSFVTLFNIASIHAADSVVLSNVTELLFWGSGCIAAFQFAVSVNRKVSRGAEKLLSFSVVFQSSALAWFVMVVVLFGGEKAGGVGAAALAAMLYIGFMGVVAMYSISLAAKVMKHSLVYGAVAPAISFMLQCYAFCNADDVSWGTKGLTKVRDVNAAAPADKARRHARFVSFRWTVIVAQLASNAGLFYVFYVSGLTQSFDFLKWLMLFSLFMLAASAVACLFLRKRDSSVSPDEPKNQPISDMPDYVVPSGSGGGQS